MKKIIMFLIYIIFIMFCCFAEETVFELINDNNFCLRVKTNSGIYVGDISIQNGVIVCIYPLINSDIQISESMITIYTDKIQFDRRNYSEKNTYRNWYFPERYKIEISNTKLSDIKKFGNYVSNKYVGEFYDSDLNIENKRYPTSCKAIVIDNLNIRSEPSLEGQIIGMVNKGDEIILYDKTDIKDKINDLEASWYKIKIENKTEGWIFGGYVKIFFEDEDLGKEDKAGILNSIFYGTNPNNYSFNAIGLYDNSISMHITIINDYVRCYSPWSNVQVLRENGNIVIYADKLVRNNKSEWNFPKRYKVSITEEDLKKIKRYPEGYGVMYFDDNIHYPTTCNAIVIKDGFIYNSPSLNAKKIKKIYQKEEVCLIEEDSNGNGFYKIKINKDKYGWILTNSVRIFFDRDDTDRIEKAGIIKSMETK